jgi:hypothetical protein
MKKNVVYPVLFAVALPLGYKLYSKRFHVYPILYCGKHLVACMGEPECKAMLECFQECANVTSERRRVSAITYQYLQFPEDPAVCQYECLLKMTTPISQDVIECIGINECMEPSQYSDECASLAQRDILALSSIPKNKLEGKWKKVYTNSWDIWPCQTTEFFSPLSQQPEPRPWMTAWPKDETVWRMDLNWTVHPNTEEEATFHMSNEMTPNEKWDFSSSRPSLKTKAIMWGTEAHENWYFLDYDPKGQTILMYVCAYTPALERKDSITMVLMKEGGSLSDESARVIQEKAFQILGVTFGTLQHIEPCETNNKNERPSYTS